MWGQDSVLMFVLDDGEVNVVNSQTRVPQKGVSLIALVSGEAVAV